MNGTYSTVEVAADGSLRTAVRSDAYIGRVYLGDASQGEVDHTVIAICVNEKYAKALTFGLFAKANGR